MLCINHSDPESKDSSLKNCQILQTSVNNWKSIPAELPSWKHNPPQVCEFISKDFDTIELALSPHDQVQG